MSLPKNALQLEFVHGYRGHDCRSNLYYTSENKLVYHAAGLGVTYDGQNHTQSFFQHHLDDVISLAIHPNRKIAATGQIGKNPFICVWDVESGALLAKLANFHQRGICALDFSLNGRMIASVGLDDKHTVAIWDWENSKLLTSQKGSQDKIFAAKFSTFDDTLVTAGVKHCKFWKVSRNVINGKKGIFGRKGAVQTILDVAFLNKTEQTITATSSGDLFIWSENKLVQTINYAHKGPIFSVFADDDQVISGGKDGKLRFWSVDLEPTSTVDLSSSGSYGVTPAVRSIDNAGAKTIVGCRTNEIFEVDAASGDVKMLLNGHASGEVWALAVHPTEPVYATASDDGSIRVYDAKSRRPVCIRLVDEEVRAAAYSPDGACLAVGFKDGGFAVLASDTLEDIRCRKHRREEISDLKYSPDGKYLAVGSHDNFVDVYEVAENYRRIGYCRGHSSFITHLDWSQDSKVLQTNSGDYEHLFWDAATTKQIRLTGSDMDAIRQGPWASWTGVLGDEVNGIWPKYSDKTDVNAAHRSGDGAILATADDFGTVKIFSWPVEVKNAPNKRYTGHSSHVTNIRFTNGDEFVISTGGNDACVFQWKHVGAAGSGSDADSGAEEGYGSQDTDSDVNDDTAPVLEKPKSKRRPSAREKRQKQREDAASRQTAGSDGAGGGEDGNANQSAVDENGVTENADYPTPSTFTPTAESFTQPEASLKLEFVHGYRGQDSRNNVFYSSNNEIVFSAAALGIVYNKESHTQRFYRGHTDDVVSLAMHPNGRIVATGQMGKNPAIHVWDCDTLDTLATLKWHQRAVCSLAFSENGRLLASVGRDDYNSVALWEWAKGKLLSSSKSSGNTNLGIVFNPADCTFVSFGVKDLQFWTTSRSALKKKKAIFGKLGSIQTVIACAFQQDGNAVVGTQGGDLYEFCENKLVKTVPRAHQGPTFAVAPYPDGFISGGKDGYLCFWTPDLECTKKLNLCDFTDASDSKPCVKAINYKDGKVVIGCKSCEIFELDLETEQVTTLLNGHAKGELWAVATHPMNAAYASGSDDGTVRTWDVASRKVVQLRNVGEKVRSLAYSPDGSTLACGCLDGTVLILNTETLEEVKQFRHRREEISDVKYSPDGSILAVGSHDNFVDVYDVEASYRRKGYCRGHSSFITHLDFSADGQFIQTNSGDYEHLYWETATTKHLTRTSEYKDVQWATWTCVLGWPVQGIWPKYSDKTDVNAADRASSVDVLATADDFGTVKLFRYPVIQKNMAHRAYGGHSSHVTNVRFLTDDSYLISAGGNDQCLFQWKFFPTSDADHVEGDDEQDADDSDVDEEVSLSYSSKGR